jgi:hypothetical protein
MKPDTTQLDAYFSGQSNAEEERTLADQLAADPLLADHFVAQAKLDALLGEIYRDHRTEEFHVSLVSLMQPPEPVLMAAPKVAKVVRGPFPYWRQVAAVLVGGLLLWGIIGVWHGASQVAETKRHQSPRAQAESVMASAGAGKAPQTEDRALEAWLREYYVDAQPATAQSLVAWLGKLVEHEFPLHNHLNKHQRLGWEIRAKDALVKEQLERKSLHLSCGPASLLTQVQGIAALAGCEVHVETDKIVLTPIVESDSGLETRTITLADGFGNSAWLVNSVVVAQNQWMDDYLLTDSAMEAKSAQASADDAIRMKLISSGIDWREGSGVAEVTNPVPQVTFSIPSNDEHVRIREYREVNVPDSGLVVASPLQANVTNSPKGLRQLEILAGLRSPAVVPSNFQILDFTFPVSEAPKDQERVLTVVELAELEARWRKTATVYQAAIQPPAPEESKPLAGLLLTAYDDATSSDITTDGRWIKGRISEPLASKSMAKLSLQRSGEALRISGAINLIVTPEIKPMVADMDDGITLNYQPGNRPDPSKMHFIVPDNVSWDIDSREPAAPVRVHDLEGVDVALTLFEGQTGFVVGPQENGQVHYYLLKWVK